MADESEDFDRGALGDEGQRAFKLGQAALESGDLGEALRLLEVAVALVPLMPFPYLFQAQALVELDRVAEARESLNHAIDAARAVGMEDIAERARAMLATLEVESDS